MSVARNPRAKRLLLIVKMAEDHEQQCLTAWGEGQRQLKQAEEQLQELNVYLNDYQMKLTSNNAQGAIGSGQIQNIISFINQLKNAVEQQSSHSAKRMAKCLGGFQSIRGEPCDADVSHQCRSGQYL